MSRLLIWRGVDEWRAEASHVRIEDDRVTATGTQLGVTPEPYRLDYSLRTGPDFVTERLELSALVGGALKRLLLTRRADGTWTADDRPLPELAGALDTDVLASPVFNSMAVLRHGMLRGGEARDLVMASGDFTADIQFDEDGLVRLYEDYLVRV